jgi:putative salt-induced outer membrane protein
MGVRYKFVNTKKHKFSVYANILYAIDAIEESSTDTSYKDEYMSYKTKIVYSWQIIKNLKFKQELTYRTQADEIPNYFIYSKSTLSSRLSDIFSAGISYKFDYKNKISIDKTSTDGTLTFNLMADY